jgi:hypothetical protein
MNCKTVHSLVACLCLLSLAAGATVNEQAAAKKASKSKTAKPKTPPKVFPAGLARISEQTLWPGC